VAKAHNLEVPGLLNRVVAEHDEGAAAVISELAVADPAPMGTPPQEGAGHMALTGGIVPPPLLEAGQAQAEEAEGADKATTDNEDNGGSTAGRSRRTRAAKGGSR